jgi:hypothetical protein
MGHGRMGIGVEDLVHVSVGSVDVEGCNPTSSATSMGPGMLQEKDSDENGS